MEKKEIKARIRLIENELETLRAELDAPEIPKYGTVVMYINRFTKTEEVYLVISDPDPDMHWALTGVYLDGPRKGCINRFTKSAVQSMEVYDGFII